MFYLLVNSGFSEKYTVGSLLGLVVPNFFVLYLYIGNISAEILVFYLYIDNISAEILGFSLC